MARQSRSRETRRADGRPSTSSASRLPEFQRRAVGEQDALVAVDREHRLADRLQHLGQASFGGAHRLARLASDAGHREMQPDPRQQFARAERFGQIIVRAGFERLTPRAVAGFGRQQDNRNPLRRRIGAQPAEQRIPVALSQRGVGDRKVRGRTDRGKGGAPIRQLLDAAAGRSQNAVQPLADRRIRVADKDARRAAVRVADQRSDIGAAREYLGKNLLRWVAGRRSRPRLLATALLNLGFPQIERRQTPRWRRPVPPCHERGWFPRVARRATSICG